MLASEMSQKDIRSAAAGVWIPRLCTRVIIHLLDHPEDPDQEDQEELLLLVTCALWAVRDLDDGPSRFTVIHGALFFLERLKPHISILVANEDPLAIGHKLFVATLMISQKFYLNEQYSHKYYAERVARQMISAQLLGQLEKKLLDDYLNLEELNDDTMIEQLKAWTTHTEPLMRLSNRATAEGKRYPLYRTGLIKQ
ncbi:hypothetical protein EST38_g12259 [Candolleomyces aberdarensis]|uniref:Uncharacterized protein n=1 Tax=Candolleomyces aberdarensis TaxID=2316362 RepID=A0A4Q2D4X0_9AGAR|nr:hypothetical protein EST38_g12259 [Candolleomyces aberdarensis]